MRDEEFPLMDATKAADSGSHKEPVVSMDFSMQPEGFVQTTCREGVVAVWGPLPTMRRETGKDVVRDVVWETFTARVGWAVCGLLRARESDLGAVCAVAKSTRTGEGEARPPPPVRSPVAGTTQIPELSVPAEDQPLFHESGRSTKVAVQRSSTSCFLRAQVLAALGRDGAISILSFPCPEPDAPRIQVPGHGLFPSGLTFVRGDASLITTGEHSPPSAALRCARLHAPAARG
jgi:hypothetical protein